MRLAKKIAAIVLAAAMSVSMLTACGGGGSSTGGSNSNSSSSGSKPSSSSSASSGASSSSSSSSASSGSGSTASSDSNSGSTSDGKTIAYEKSRTAKFFQKMESNNHTISLKATKTLNGMSESSNSLISTNGNRTYYKNTETNGGNYVNQTEIILKDDTQNKLWIISPEEKEVKPGKYGYYIVRSSEELGAGDVFWFQWMFGFEEGIFGVKTETRGAYYIESQTVEIGNTKASLSYWYEGNNSTPKYVEMYQKEAGESEESMHTEIISVDYKAESKYMDFEKILENYIDVTDRMPSNETQS